MPFNGDLRDNCGNSSSMRFNNRILTLTSCFLLLGIGAYILINAINKNYIDGGIWAGMGTFVASIGVLLGGSYYNQQSQKRAELHFQESVSRYHGIQDRESRQPNKQHNRVQSPTPQYCGPTKNSPKNEEDDHDEEVF